MSTDSQKRILIIGAGAAGILMGIRLLEKGHTNFEIIEKAETLGGTWRDNKYPGIACDVPAHYYSYSFEPNVSPARVFATGPELWEYFNHVAEKYDVAQYIRYGTEATSAVWDGRRWKLTAQTGEEFIADIVVSAVGRLHQPNIPDIEGIENFEGLITHSSRWDPSYSLKGKRLGVIGTGSSAVQITSAAAHDAERLDLFQRTAQWVFPIEDEEIPLEVRQQMKKSPDYARQRYVEVGNELMKLAGAVVDGDTDEVAAREKECQDALDSVRDPELRAKLTPNYKVGCKRLVMSGTFYQAVQRSNVNVITDGITRIEAGGIRTVVGALHELDVIILATGFHADSYLRPMKVTGEDGKTLDDIWSDIFHNYKSVALPHMPNFFTINGPFSPGGSLSILAIIENHVGYISQLIDRIIGEDVAISPSPERSAELLDAVREKAKGTVWFTGGCTSWYLDKNGVPLVNPLTLAQLEADMEEPIYDDYLVRRLASASV